MKSMLKGTYPNLPIPSRRTRSALAAHRRSPTSQLYSLTVPSCTRHDQHTRQVIGIPWRIEMKVSFTLLMGMTGTKLLTESQICTCVFTLTYGAWYISTHWLSHAFTSGFTQLSAHNPSVLSQRRSDNTPMPISTLQCAQWQDSEEMQTVTTAGIANVSLRWGGSSRVGVQMWW